MPRRVRKGGKDALGGGWLGLVRLGLFDELEVPGL